MFTGCCFLSTTAKNDSGRNDESKPRLALAMAMQGKIDECITFWGICCSSWIHMNSGTSKRDFLTPMGCPAFASVEKANLLTARLVSNDIDSSFQLHPGKIQ